MDSDVQALIDQTGVAIPLAGRIVRILVESGATKKEIHAAFDIAGKVISLLSVPFDEYDSDASDRALSAPE